MRFLWLPLVGISLSLSTSTYCQGFAEEERLLKWLRSGFEEVHVFHDSAIESIYEIDTISRTITQHVLRLTDINPAIPSYDNKYSSSEIIETQFDEEWKPVFIRKISFMSFLIETLHDTSEPDAPDTTLIKYNYPFLKDWAMNTSHYRIRNGKRLLIRTEYFGYDNKSRLILRIQEDGRTQFYYVYDDKDRIVYEFVMMHVRVKYEYNDSDQIIKRSWEGGTITYEYNEHSLLSREIVEDSYPGEWTYQYK